MNKNYSKMDFYEAWKAQYNDYIDSGVNCDAIEELIFDTLKYVEWLETQSNVKREAYLFAIEMTKILGINANSNIGPIKTLMYDCFINAILMNIFYGTHRGYIKDSYTIYLNTERLNDPTELKIKTYEDFQVGIIDLEEDFIEMYGEDEA